MIIESLPQDEILYTYISLTETNEAKDFSLLFAERWFASLKENYPKIDTTLAVPFMQSILRESGNGIIASLFALVPGLNKGLKSTKAKVFDPAYPPPSEGKGIDTSLEIANVFGNVPEIHERLWVVMVDEIERARFDEIYRVIEIIERYKNEGRTGMPIRVVFILCVSDARLRRYLQEYKTNMLSHLISSFFFGGSKNLTMAPIFLPPIPSEKKLQYFKDKLMALNNSLDENQKEVNLEENLSNVYFDTFSHAATFESDENKRLSRVFGLIGFSPRLIDRCIGGLYFTFGAYQKESNISRPKVRMSDLLIMEYIRIRYPHIMLFFTEYADRMRSQFDNESAVSPLSIGAYLEREEYRQGKKRIADLIAEASGKEDMNEKEKNRAEDLVAFACRYFPDYWNSQYETSVDAKRGYLGTLSDPHELWNYLHMTIDGEDSPYVRLDALYSEHRKGQLNIAGISLQDLHGYGRFLIDAGNVPVEMHLDVLGDIARRLIKGEIKIQSKNVEGTTYDAMVFEFSYTLLVSVESVRNDAERSSNDTMHSSRVMDEAFMALASVLKSPGVTTGAKFKILNSFANDTRGRGSEIHTRFADAFAYMLKHNNLMIRDLIGYVFNEYGQRYFRDEKSIYDNEENFFYVMYQGWSGKKDNVSEVENIRQVAKRDLEKHVDALELYWNRYFLKEEWGGYKDALRSVFDEPNSNSLYMPLATLVKRTERASNLSEATIKKMAFWRPAVDDPVYQQKENLRDATDTLRHVLIEKEFLKE